MEALEFAKQKRRMCNLYYREEIGCRDCPLNFTELCSIGDNGLKLENDAEIISTVEKWAKEHLEKTRQSEFLKTFPNAPLKDSCLQIKPCQIDPKYTFYLLKDRGVSCLKRTCDYCCRKYWLAPLEDTNG